VSGNIECVRVVLYIKVMYGTIFGNSIFINFGFKSSTPEAFDLISNIDLRTSDSVKHAKLKLLSQVPLGL